jgi:hypothetical protein
LNRTIASQSNARFRSLVPQNLRAFWAQYGRHAHDWSTIGMADDASARRLLESHPRERRDSPGV